MDSARVGGAGVDGARVVVAALTFRRLDDVVRILPLLVAQAVQVDPVAAVLIVDNDPDGSARGLVEAFDPGVVGVSGSDAVVVRYVHEPVPGIAAARNRALVEAGAADVLVFIDDDETPCAGWLARLVAQWRADGSTAVAGPVHAVYDCEPDPWILGAGVTVKRSRPSGARIEWVGTGNLLLDLAQVRALGLSFDVRFGISGGEDSMFSAQLVHRGGVMTWCAEAEATELVSAARLTRQWVTQRRFRYGNSRTRIKLELSRTPRERFAVRLAAHREGMALLARGTAGWLRGIARSRPEDCGRGVTQIANALGTFSGAYGRVYVEYRRV